MTFVAKCPNCGGEMKLESRADAAADVAIMRAIVRISMCDRCREMARLNRRFQARTNGGRTWSEFSQPKEQ